LREKEGEMREEQKQYRGKVSGVKVAHCLTNRTSEVQSSVRMGLTWQVPNNYSACFLKHFSSKTKEKCGGD
jgi:hypothetical protein